MVIYNLHAVLNALITVVAFVPVFVIANMYTTNVEQNTELMIFMIVAVATVVSSFTEMFGIKGRVFFMPMWLVGWGLSLCFANELMGGPGVLGVSLVGVGLMAMMFVVGRIRKGIAGVSTDVEVG